MKRVGLIDNLQDLPGFISKHYETATASQVMAATGGNTGNLAFVYAIKKLIANPMSRMKWGDKPATIRESVDHLVVCCANQLGSHVDLGDWADRLEQFQLPVTLIGLGIQSASVDKSPDIPDGTIRFLNVVKNLSEAKDSNIGVRGEATKRFLDEKRFKSIPLGCPSLHISDTEKLGEKILNFQESREIKKIAVAAGNLWHRPSADFEKMLKSIVDTFSGEYILQHPVTMLQLSFGEGNQITHEKQEHFLEIYNDFNNFNELLEWYRRNSSVYLDVATWIRSLQRFDLAIGPRYHGIALALQAGIPACVITIDGRTEELCHGTSVKCIALKDAKRVSQTDLIDMARWTVDDANKFDLGRLEKALLYKDFLLDNDLMPS